jgi:hypothetical protein
MSFRVVEKLADLLGQSSNVTVQRSSGLNGLKTCTRQTGEDVFF